MSESKPLNAYYERACQSEDGRRIIVRSAAITNGVEAPFLVGNDTYYGVAMMGIDTPQGQVPHQFQFPIEACSLVEAFQRFHEAGNAAVKDEQVRVLDQMRKQSLMNVGRN